MVQRLMFDVCFWQKLNVQLLRFTQTEMRNVYRQQINSESASPGVESCIGVTVSVCTSKTYQYV